jgi:hypothetical protein
VTVTLDVKDEPGRTTDGDGDDAETEKSPGSIFSVTVAPSLITAAVLLKSMQQYVVPIATPTEIESLWTTAVLLGTSQSTTSNMVASDEHPWKGVTPSE